MRNLLITIGSPASGKSTWIRENNLESFCICPDNLRLLLSSPTMGVDGKFTINQNKDNQIWKLLDQLLEERMSTGEFTVIDACHTRKKYLSRYKKLCDKYRYRLYGKKFNPSLDELLKRNNSRASLDFVPEEVIRLHHERLKSLNIPKAVQLIDNKSELNEFVRYEEVNRPNIFFIGDIHGCIDPLNSFLDDHYNQHDLFVLCGDYIDRGPASDKVVKRLWDLYQNGNVILLEGNHEKWMWLYGCNNEDEILSKEFKYNTANQLQSLDKSDIRQFCRRMRTFATLSHKGRKLVCCHGGISSPNFDFISTKQLITGTGRYGDVGKVADAWMSNSKENEYLIHGHRNYDLSTRAKDRVFNLEDNIYNGGNLRVVKFGDDIDTFEYKSNYIHDPHKVNTKEVMDNRDIVHTLRTHGGVIEKKFAHVSSFSFKRSVFRKRKWDNVTIRARGLFVNNETNNVVVRSYEKFFNINERIETRLENLSKLKFPVNIYKKENGFLGLASYDEKTNAVIYTSKSSLEGDFAGWVRDNLCDRENVIYEICKEHNCTLVFEVCLPTLDPHIIKYNQDTVVLLDAIINSFTYEKLNDDKLSEFGYKLNLPVKEKISTIDRYIDFVEMYENFTSSSKLEGFVLEDSEGFMTKCKTDYYNKWKKLRSLKHKVFDSQFIVSNAVFDSESIKFLNWCRSKDRNFVCDSSIIDLREGYYDRLQSS